MRSKTARIAEITQKEKEAKEKAEKERALRLKIFPVGSTHYNSQNLPYRVAQMPGGKRVFRWGGDSWVLSRTTPAHKLTEI